MAVNVGATKELMSEVVEAAPDGAARVAETLDIADFEELYEQEGGSQTTSAKRRLSPMTTAAVLGALIFAAMVGLCCWLGLRAHRAEAAGQVGLEYLEAGRQGAVNLTTISYQHPDTDVQRILASATGEFFDDFSKRSQPFIEAIKLAKSSSEGAVTAAGIESESADGADVLVAVTVKTSTSAVPQQVQKSWRMRITVRRVGGEAKVSNVSFVP